MIKVVHNVFIKILIHVHNVLQIQHIIILINLNVYKVVNIKFINMVIKIYVYYAIYQIAKNVIKINVLNVKININYNMVYYI